MFRGRIRSIHFVGIGGIGMSGIAEVLLAHGFEVSGSDTKMSEITERLQGLGGRIVIGHAAENVNQADVVVFSSAVKRDNPELVMAKQRHIPVIPRAEMLAELMRLKDGIAIAGSHGKTTTTSLIATVLTSAGLDPTVIIGGRLNALGTNAARGDGVWLVAEADESDGSFLHLTPTIAVITNIDPEHLDHYQDAEGVRRAFVDFATRVPFYGLVVACMDHPVVQSLLPDLEKRVVTYGLSATADYRAIKVAFNGLRSSFELVKKGTNMGHFEVNMPGVHNVQNALATIAVADEINADLGTVREALSEFKGVHRRFTVIGTVQKGRGQGATVVDDYGHHPAEIEATLTAAQALGQRILLVFQPHRFTRTRDLMGAFSSCFNRADKVALTPIYAAGESPIEGIDSKYLAGQVVAHGHRSVDVLEAKEEAVAWLKANVRPKDLILVMGAGDISKMTTPILEGIEGLI